MDGLNVVIELSCHNKSLHTLHVMSPSTHFQTAKAASIITLKYCHTYPLFAALPDNLLHTEETMMKFFTENREYAYQYLRHLSTIYNT